MDWKIGAMATCLLLGQTLFCVAKEVMTFKTHSWDGGVYTDGNTDSFSHCAANADYKHGVAIIVSVDKNYDWRVGFFNDRWPADMDVSTINYRFDGGKWQSISSKSMFEGKTVFVDFPENNVVQLFRKSRLLEVFFQGQRYGFDLVGSAGMISDLVTCVKVNTEDSAAVSEAPAPKPSTKTKKSAPTSISSKGVETAAPEANPVKSSGYFSGTGVLVSNSGHILTNHHVVEKCQTIMVIPIGQLPLEADSIASDSQNDLAVLKIKNGAQSTTVAQFRLARPKLGENISVFGFPLSDTLSSSGNFVSGSISSLAGMGDDARMLQISAPIQPGNSGGPLMDSAGNVVGIVSSKLNELAYASVSGTLPQNVNFSIKGNVALNFMDAHSVPYETATETNALESSLVAEKSKQFTVRVTCER